MGSEMKSVGIMSKDATLSSAVNTAYALAGGIMANKGMKMMICCELTRDHIWLKSPATIVLTTISLEKAPVSYVSKLSMRFVKI